MSDVLVVLEVSRRLDEPAAGVLAPLGPCSALEFQLRRLAPLRSLVDAQIVVATTDLPREDPVAAAAEAAAVPVVRGRDGDPLGWLTIAHARWPADAVVRVVNDAPLSDPYVVLSALRLHADAGAQHTSNLLPRTYPRGLEVEVLSRRALAAAELEARSPAERRAVTRTIVTHPERFRLANVTSGHDASEEDWSVVNPASLQRIRSMLSSVADPEGASWNRILSITGRARRTLPGALRLVPEPGPEPGSSPWVRKWSATVDGLKIGEVAMAVDGGSSRRDVRVPDEWREATLELLFELLLDDPQAPAP